MISFQILSQFWRRFAMHSAEWVRIPSTLSFVTKRRSKRKCLKKFFSTLPLCHKMRVKTKHQNENFYFSYRCTFSPPPVYALCRYLLCLSITPLCYKLRFKNDSSWRNSSHLPIAQNRGVKRNTFWKLYTFFKKWEQDSYCELRLSSPLYRTKWGSKRKCFLKISQKTFPGSKNAGSERITHSLPAEDLALLTVAISVQQS